MDQTKYAKVVDSVRHAEASLRKMATDANLPATFKQQMTELADQLRGHDLDQYREPLKPVTGEVLTLDEVKDYVIEASGYTKWEADETEDEAGVPAFVFRDDYGLDVKDGDVKVYEFERNTRNRDAVYGLTISCIAGLVYVSYFTDRAGMGEGPMANNNLLKFLKDQVF